MSPKPNTRPDPLHRVLLAGNLIAVLADLHLQGQRVSLQYGVDVWNAALADLLAYMGVNAANLESLPEVLEEIEIRAPAEPVAPASSRLEEEVRP